MLKINVASLEKRLNKLEGGPKPPVQRIVVMFGEDSNTDTFEVLVNPQTRQHAYDNRLANHVPRTNESA